LCEVLPHADVVIASSAAPHYVIQPHRVRHALEQRPTRPIFLIDISVPRIIDPEVGHLEGAYLYNLDDLTSIVERNLTARASKIPQAQKIIAAALERYLHWYAMYQNRAVLQQRQVTLEVLVQQEMAKMGPAVHQLTPRKRQALEGATRHRLSAQLERFPIFVTVLGPAQRVN
jgi:glutamyl-tRNA reductase